MPEPTRRARRPKNKNTLLVAKTSLIALSMGLTVGAFGCLTTSYVSGEEGSRSVFSSVVLPVLVAIVVVLIFDIANPHKGFIGISQQPMVDLRQSIAAPPGG